MPPAPPAPQQKVSRICCLAEAQSIFLVQGAFFFMHHQRTELLFLALISIFNFLLPHFSCFVQLAFPSTAPGTGRAAAPCRWPGSAGRLAAGLCPWSTRTHSVPLGTTKPRDSVKNEVPGLAPM